MNSDLLSKVIVDNNESFDTIRAVKEKRVKDTILLWQSFETLVRNYLDPCEYVSFTSGLIH